MRRQTRRPEQNRTTSIEIDSVHQRIDGSPRVPAAQLPTDLLRTPPLRRQFSDAFTTCRRLLDSPPMNADTASDGLPVRDERTVTGAAANSARVTPWFPRDHRRHAAELARDRAGTVAHEVRIGGDLDAFILGQKRALIDRTSSRTSAETKPATSPARKVLEPRETEPGRSWTRALRSARTSTRSGSTT